MALPLLVLNLVLGKLGGHTSQSVTVGRCIQATRGLSSKIRRDVLTDGRGDALGKTRICLTSRLRARFDLLLFNYGGIENRVAIRRRLVLRRFQGRRAFFTGLPQTVRLVWVQNRQVLMVLA